MTDPINILLVDDEPRNLDALEAILDDPGYRLLRADEAEKALRLLLHHDVAAIVLDIKMPVVSGFELANMIKGTKKFRQIPIVFLTAHLLDDRDILTGYGAGAVDYLTKPVNPDILRHKIATFAELFRKTRALAELNETLEQRVRQRTAELEQSEEALRTASRQKDLFLATLAHELRNPLAPLRTGLDILLRLPEQPPVMSRTVAAMNRQLSHMVRLIDDLLDVSRISRGTLEMRTDKVELSGVIDGAIETAQPLLAMRSQTVTVDAEPIVASVDATRIAQVIGNLLNNASKHSPSGASMRIELQRVEQAAVIRVIDQGLGIPEDQLTRVFDMFTKIDRSLPGANDGLGIGLALSRRLAELHGGTLSVASAGEGQGATFTLSIPAETALEHVPRARIEHPQPAPQSVDPLRVVVVEDNEDSADLMSGWLVRLGHEVEVTHSGPEGLAAILSIQPDVVLCDIGLPGFDGVEVCRRVMQEMSEPPVMIALTGWGMDADRQRTASAGFLHHLVKPVAMDQLLGLLRAVSREDKAAS